MITNSTVVDIKSTFFRRYIHDADFSLMSEDHENQYIKDSIKKSDFNFSDEYTDQQYCALAFYDVFGHYPIIVVQKKNKKRRKLTISKVILLQQIRQQFQREYEKIKQIKKRKQKREMLLKNV